jgi:hypothetical protein
MKSSMVAVWQQRSGQRSRKMEPGRELELASCDAITFPGSVAPRARARARASAAQLWIPREAV